MSLSYVVKSSSSAVIPMVVCYKNTSNLIANCHMIGKSSFNTCGIVLNNSNTIIKESKIEGFNRGGIISNLDETNVCKIFSTEIKNCKGAGILAMGDSSYPLIEFCNIVNNLCPAIQVFVGNKCTIRKNHIMCNESGIEIISADPHVTKNIITRNILSGISTLTIDELTCQARIYFNKINSNRGNGINCCGTNNISRIGKYIFI